MTASENTRRTRSASRKTRDDDAAPRSEKQGVVSRSRGRRKDLEAATDSSGSSSPRGRSRSQGPSPRPAARKASKPPKQCSTSSSDDNSKDVQQKVSSDYTEWGIAALLLFVTVYMHPANGAYALDTADGSPSVSYVFYYGWITAVSTGLGVLPFWFVEEPTKFWMGISNAVAAGMMTAASYSLAHEGSTVDEQWGAAAANSSFAVSAAGVLQSAHINVTADMLDTPLVRTLVGFAFGLAFIVVTGKILEGKEDLSVGNVVGASAQKMILIMFVMTLHSLTEGIGIGVSFGGKSGMQLGQFISYSLAVHNVPEGLAVALVLFPNKISKLQVGLWAIFTSLPQPLMAVPAFMFVQHFQPLLPVGLGFASGAMAFVAIAELLVEALEDVGSKPVVLGVASMALCAMLGIQELVHDRTHA